jgi:hypothetical protein
MPISISGFVSFSNTKSRISETKRKLKELTNNYSLCGKYAHLSRLKEWTQRCVDYSGSKTLMEVL